MQSPRGKPLPSPGVHKRERAGVRVGEKRPRQLVTPHPPRSRATAARPLPLWGRGMVVEFIRHAGNPPASSQWYFNSAKGIGRTPRRWSGGRRRPRRGSANHATRRNVRQSQRGVISCGSAPFRHFPRGERRAVSEWPGGRQGVPGTAEFRRVEEAIQKERVGNAGRKAWHKTD